MRSYRVRRPFLFVSALIVLCASAVLADDPQSPRRLAVSTDGTLVAVARADNRVNIWQTKDGKLLGSLATDLPMNAVAMTDNGQTVVAGGSIDDWGQVCAWRRRDGAYRQCWKAPWPKGLSALAATPDGKWVVTVDGYARIFFLELSTGKLRRAWRELGNGIGDVAILPDGKTLSTAGQTFRLWDLPHELPTPDSVVDVIVTDEQRQLLEAKYLRVRVPRNARAAQPSTDGKWVAALGAFANREGYDHDLALVDAGTGRTIRVLCPGLNDARCLAVSPENRFVAVGFDAGSTAARRHGVQIWALHDRTGPAGMDTGVGSVRSIAYLDGGKKLAIAGSNGIKAEIRLVATGQLVVSLSAL
jgi:WD40 repeat protein